MDLKAHLINVLKGYDFKILEQKQALKRCSGYLKILIDDRKYVFCEVNKLIENVGDNRTSKLIMRFEIDDNKIGYDYALGGALAIEVDSTFEDVRYFVVKAFRCHNLLYLEEDPETDW